MGRKGVGGRRWGGVMVIALAACALAPASAMAASPAEVAALQSAQCPQEYEVVFEDMYSVPEQAAALDGDFDVLLGRRADLVAPVDWSMDPYQSRSWTHWLHTLGWWMDPLFYTYREGGASGLQALTQARDLALDWIASNPQGQFDPQYAPWADKVTGDRAPYLAYLARAAACEDLITDAQATTLIDSLREHGEYLVAHHSANDHGLYGDYGLALLGEYLYFLDEAEGWGDLARERFGPSLLKRFDVAEGVWLVNTPAYQATVTNLLDLWLADVDADPALAATAQQMRWGLGWFVLPDRGLVPFGDHHTMVPLAPWVPSAGNGHRGLRTMLGSGYAVVKKRRSYFAAAASAFYRTHKQADDLSFELFDDGQRIVTDTGHYDYDLAGAWYRFQRSVAAHSVLSVDGEEFPIAAGEHYYGSGIQATGRGDGWYAVLGRNPMVRPQGVRHRRLFLYRPGENLFVVDMVRSRRRHTYRRYFQLGPEIDAARRGDGLALSAPGFDGALWSLGEPETRSAVRGKVDPIAGWSFPDYREKVPRWTVSYGSRAKSANYLTLLDLDGAQRPRAKLLNASEGLVRIRLSSSGKRRSVIRVSRRPGHSLVIRR